MGRVPAEELDSLTIENLKNISTGQITEPLRVGSDEDYGYEIYKLIRIYPSHKLSLENDYERIKRFAESFKENKEMENWINEIRETVYVDIKM